MTYFRNYYKCTKNNTILKRNFINLFVRARGMAVTLNIVG